VSRRTGLHRLEKKKKYFFLPEIDPQLLGCQAHNMVAILPEVFWLPFKLTLFKIGTVVFILLYVF
jgi:hypothetical protein